jgi:opacity protein-like surface antigen
MELLKTLRWATEGREFQGLEVFNQGGFVMRSVLFLGVIGILVLGLTAGASAELYFGGGAGGALPFKQDITGENPHNVGYTDFDPSDSVVVVGKGGYWLDSFPYLGFEGNVMVFFPDIDDHDQVRTASTGSVMRRVKAEVDVISAGAVLLGRYPFGNFVPYGGGGVAIQHVDFSKVRINGGDVRADDDTIPAVQAQGGFKYYVTPQIAIFAEYIYTTGDIDTTIGRLSSNPTALDTVEIEFDNQFVHGGIEYRFGDPFAK